MARRIAAGIDVDDDTIAKGLIKEIGPRGDGYLTADHTLGLLRSKEYMTPRVAVRGPRASWEAAGAKDTYQLAREKTRAYAGLEPMPPAGERQARLQEIIDNLDI